MKRGVLIVVGLAVIFGGLCVVEYNKLVNLDQSVQDQWAQLQNVYQRRADLVPNLVETVKGAAAFEKSTLTAVTEARARVGQTNITSAPGNAQDLQKFSAAQDSLSASLSRLLVVSEAYPQLTATQNFRDLQTQLEGTENRIAVERMRYNDAAKSFNTARNRFPLVLFAGIFGSRFHEKAYFQAAAGADVAPQVKFAP